MEKKNNIFNEIRHEIRNRNAERRLKKADRERIDRIYDKIDTLEKRQYLHKVVCLTCDHLGRKHAKEFKRERKELNSLYRERDDIKRYYRMMDRLGM